ncbi:hypothetical protein [Treponema pectinovorum]|uniref:hypothetical protein n=1 Tax=Treponema pectinovorum TaxID=164 RepID=UPI0011F3D48E|nr:hypothetical protein [Treponema pectinovorum]
MKIYKDILNALRIQTVYVLSKEILYMCFPIEIIKDTWTISCDSANLYGQVILKLKFNGVFIYLKATIIKKEQESLNAFIYELNIDESEWKKDNLKYVFFQILREMEEQATQWNKRSENRYDIGLDSKRIKAINFKSPQQIIVIDRRSLPCVVNNISYNGAKITTYQADFKKEKKVCLYLSFIQPIEQIAIIANVRNSFVKTTIDNKVVSIVSLKYENAQYEYKTRLDDFIKKVEK